MRVTFDWPRERLGSAAVTLGSFDGVHLGHQRLIATLVAQARANQESAVVITFDPHPRCVLDPANCPPQITSLNEKLGLLAGLGVDESWVLTFTREVAALPPEDFMARLDAACELRRLVLGPDFRFGHERRGDAAWLRQRGRQVQVIEGAMLHGQEIHSSDVRRLVTTGEMAAAARLLGRHFSLVGAVKKGDQIGRRLGYPTANIEVPAGKLVPGRGIYAGHAIHPTGESLAAISIGYRPTFQGRELRVEAYLLDFDQDLYGQPLELRFVARLRDEESFEGEAQLIEAIANDVAATRQLLGASG